MVLEQVFRGQESLMREAEPWAENSENRENMTDFSGSRGDIIIYKHLELYIC